MNFEPIIALATSPRVGHARQLQLELHNIICAMAMFLLRSNVNTTGLLTQVWKRTVHWPLTSHQARWPAKLASWTWGASHSWQRLHDHHFCAHSPTLLTNPEHSELVTECIFHALWVRTQTSYITNFCHSENIYDFVYIYNVYLREELLHCQLPRNTYSKAIFLFKIEGI